MNNKTLKSRLSFESHTDIIKSLRIIKKEYIRNSIKVYFSLIFIAGAYFIYFIFLLQFFPDISNTFVIDQITAWSFLILYLLFRFFILSYIRFSPSLIQYLKDEINNLGFDLKKKYKINMSFFLFNSFSILFFLISYLLITFIDDFNLKILIIRILIIYFFISLSYPIIRGLMHDKFIVKLKNGYYIQFHLQFRIIKPKGLEPQSIKIFLSSNRLGYKFNNEKKIIYNNITETRWLPKNGRKTFPIFSLNPCLYFHEFAIPINFQTQFFNLVESIRDWDLKYKK